ERVDTEVHHPVLNVDRSDAGVAREVAEAVARHLEAPRAQVWMRLADAADLQQLLLHVVVREHGEIRCPPDRVAAHRPHPGVGLDDLRDVPEKLADAPDSLRSPFAEPVALAVE